MPYLSVVGHTNIDVILTVEKMPGPGVSAPVQQRETVYGGTACNIAYHAACLGIPTRLWSRVGTDFPQQWRAKLEDAGLDLEFLEIDDEAPTPTCFILTDKDGQQSYCMDQAAMRQLENHQPPEALLDDLQGWLHISTGPPLAYEAVMLAARSRGINVALDPGQEIHFAYDGAKLRQVMQHADLLWLNEVERDRACSLLGCGPTELTDFVPTVIVTLGADGVRLLQRGEPPVHVEAHPAKAVDPTGAGDAFRAGWYAAVASGQSYAEALHWGAAAAAQNVEHIGPQTARLDKRKLSN